MEKELVPYEECLVLKELGFDERCFRFYWQKPKELRIMGGNAAPKTNSQLIKKSMKGYGLMFGMPFCSAPLYQQAFKWFRSQGYDCEILKFPIQHTMYGKYYSFEITKGNHDDWGTNEEFISYEEAELEALRMLITILKRIKK